MNKVSDRWVSRLLTLNQKYTRLITSKENLTLFEEDPAGTLKHFLTQDKCWVHHFEPDTVHVVEISLPTCIKISQACSVRRQSDGFNFWGDAKWIVFVDYFPKGHTISRKYYANFLKQLQKFIKTKRPGKLTKRVSSRQGSSLRFLGFNGFCV